MFYYGRTREIVLRNLRIEWLKTVNNMPYTDPQTCLVHWNKPLNVVPEAPFKPEHGDIVTRGLSAKNTVFRRYATTNGCSKPYCGIVRKEGGPGGGQVTFGFDTEGSGGGGNYDLDLWFTQLVPSKELRVRLAPTMRRHPNSRIPGHIKWHNPRQGENQSKRAANSYVMEGIFDTFEVDLRPSLRVYVTAERMSLSKTGAWVDVVDILVGHPSRFGGLKS